MENKEYLIKKNERGITLLVLAITIVVLLIIASITVYEGSNVLKESVLQKNIANMLSIKSKIKGYSEEIDSKTWNEDDENKEEAKSQLFGDYNLSIIPDISDMAGYNIFYDTDYNNESEIPYTYVYYYIENQALDNMKLSNLKENDENRYIAVFAKETDGTGDYVASDIIYIGNIIYDGQVYHTLSELQSLLPD